MFHRIPWSMCSSVELDKIGNCLRNGRQKWEVAHSLMITGLDLATTEKVDPTLCYLHPALLTASPGRAMEAHHQILAGDLYNHELCSLDNFPLTSLMFPFHMVVGHYWLPRIPCNSWLFTPVRALVGLFSDFPDLSNPPSQTFLLQSLP